MNYTILGLLFVLILQGCNEVEGEYEAIAIPLKREERSFMVDLAFCNNMGRDSLLLFEYQLRIDFDTVRLFNDLVELASHIQIVKQSRCNGIIATSVKLDPRITTEKADTTYRLEGLVTINLLSDKSVILDQKKNESIKYDYPITEKSINSKSLFYTERFKKINNNIVLLFDFYVEYDSFHKVSNIKLISKTDDFLKVRKGVFYLGDMESISENGTGVYLKEL